MVADDCFAIFIRRNWGLDFFSFTLRLVNKQERNDEEISLLFFRVDPQIQNYLLRAQQVFDVAHYFYVALVSLLDLLLFLLVLPLL
jgi:hypothetical protein